jgi:hypothetical protein
MREPREPFSRGFLVVWVASHGIRVYAVLMTTTECPECKSLNATVATRSGSDLVEIECDDCGFYDVN